MLDGGSLAIKSIETKKKKKPHNLYSMGKGCSSPGGAPVVFLACLHCTHEATYPVMSCRRCGHQMSMKLDDLEHPKVAHCLAVIALLQDETSEGPLLIHRGGPGNEASLPCRTRGSPHSLHLGQVMTLCHYKQNLLLCIPDLCSQIHRLLSGGKALPTE